ncbi:MAG TPA: aminotransferase class I/II-fold pyridoxal phosphate-dependent enzyme [Pseudonocardiaceae bacterium]|nr:aminotransferase class I/II-fold pyridoxal phosphate-dependent enzyme [Pseudonocardiaceae bacterium]
MTVLAPTAAGVHAPDVSVLSTGDVRVPVHPVLPMAGPRRADQPYWPPAGGEALRTAIAGYMTRQGRGGIDARQVLVASGARSAILSVLAGALGDRTEVLLPSPYWASYPTLISAAGGVPVVVPGRPHEGELDLDDLRAARTSRTGALIVNSPRNPDGAVTPADQLTDVVRWTADHGILLLFDQIYRGIPLSGGPAPSVLDLWPELPDHCVVIDGLTKSHALAGLRLGWAVASDSVLGPAVAFASHVLGGACSYAQDVALAVLADGTSGELGATLDANLDHGLSSLAGIPGVRCPRPRGGIFLFPDLREWLAGEAPDGARADVAEWLRLRHRVAVVDGAAFAASGHLRLSFALPADQLRTGIVRLRRALIGGQGGE